MIEGLFIRLFSDVHLTGLDSLALKSTIIFLSNLKSLKLQMSQPCNKNRVSLKDLTNKRGADITLRQKIKR